MIAPPRSQKLVDSFLFGRSLRKGSRRVFSSTARLIRLISWLTRRVGSLRGFGGLGFIYPKKKQTLRRAGIHRHPDAFHRAELAAMSTWRRGWGEESRAGGSAKWDRDRGDERCR